MRRVASGGCRVSVGVVTAVAVGLVIGVVPVVAGPALAEPAPSPSAPLPPGGSFVPVPPTRLVDTRDNGPVATSVRVYPEESLPNPLPATAAEVLVNVTVVDAVGPGYVVVGEDHGTSNGNYVGGSPSATLALVPLERTGPGVPPSFPVTLSTPAHVVVDLQGYVTTREGATSSSFTALPSATRVADSREGIGLHPFGAGETQSLDVRGGAHLPTDATAVIANLTVASATAGTYVSGSAPIAGQTTAVSLVNAAAGDIVANRALLPLDADGHVSLYNLAGRTDLVVDVVGYLAPDPDGSWFEPATPIRLLDTTGRSADVQATVVGGDSDLGNTPSVHDLSPTTAVWLTVVGDQPAGPGYVTAGPGGARPYGTSDLDLVPFRAVANAGPVRVSPTDGSVTITASVPTRLVADLGGWFRRTATTATAGLWASATPDPAPYGEWALPSSLPAAFVHAVYTADRTESGARAYAVTAGGGVERSSSIVFGQGRPVAFFQPTPVDDLDGTTALASAPDSSPSPAVYALRGTGKLRGFGSNAFGQLGRAPSSEVADSDQATTVSLPGPATAVFATPAVGLAVLAGGTVVSWGDPANDGLGRPATTTPWVPAPVAFPSGPPVQVAGTGFLTFALDAAGRTVAWGTQVASSPTPFTGGCAVATSLFGDFGGVWELCSDGTVRHLTDAAGMVAHATTVPVEGVTALGPSGGAAIRVLFADGRVADADDDGARYEAGFTGVTAFGGTRQLQVTLVGS